jgi:hypothetical protein
MLASDMNNPDFHGASDPDAGMIVKFFSRPMHIPARSEAEGRPIFEDTVWVRIQAPGDALSVIEVPVRDDHKARFPRHWAFFKNSQNEGGQVGTPLSQWPLLTPSQAEELRAQKFHTVENIAHASDEQLNRMGMSGGMSPFALREKAHRYLTVAKDVSTVSLAVQELEAKKKELADQQREHQESMRRMQEQMEQMKKAMEEMSQKRGPGRPRKEVETQ